MERIAFKGGTLIDGTGKEPIENSVILIEDNRIVKVGSEREVHIEKDYTIVDISNQVIMPGLIDTHVHLGGALSPSDLDWVLEPLLQKAVVSVSQAEACLNNGITTVGDISRNGVYLRDMINKGILRTKLALVD